MFTDPKRIRLSDPGHPEECNVYSYYSVFAPEKKEDVYQWCTKAQKGCTECKMIFAEALIKHLAPIQQKRKEFEGNKARVQETLNDGQTRAQRIARETLHEVREIIFG